MDQNMATTNYHDRIQALFENVQILRDNMKAFAATFNRPAEARPVKPAESAVNRSVDAQAIAASIDIPMPTKKQVTETAETQNEAAKVVAGIDIDALLAGTNLDKERGGTPQVVI